MPFLIGGVLLYWLGVSIAVYAGAPLHATALLWGQVAVTLTQLMTHYANDYFDLDADRANLTPTQWSGGSRVLTSGALPPTTARTLALVCAALALGANAVLSLIIAAPGLGGFALLITAQALAWFYSAPPLRLHSRGIGELTTAVTVTALTPITGYFLQTGRIDGLVVLAVIPLCCLQIAMLLSIEFPDEAGDRAVGKRTLVVRLGAARAIWLYALLLIAAFAVLPALVAAGLPSAAAWAVALLIPLALMLLWRVRRGDWRDPARWNGLAFYTIVLLMAAAAAEMAAFVLLIGLR
ncbi:MAG: prenyltransferase [Chloroflexota bacterium]|nr:prenyltransferase [Chloroflexota bacterium]